MRTAIPQVVFPPCRHCIAIHMPREMVSLLLAAVHNDVYEMADGDILATTYSDVLMCYMLEGTYPPNKHAYDKLDKDILFHIE